MSLIRNKLEHRTILDFSKGKVSENSVKQALRQADVLELTNSTEVRKLIVNRIKVGMYMIYLRFSDMDTSGNRKRLKQYGKFSIHIYEEDRSGSRSLINLNSDSRFKSQYWTSINRNSGFLMKNLADVIIHCDRLNHLKAFL